MMQIYEKYPKVLCHNDVLYANFIESDEKDYLIDYEYAGNNILLFDIASFLSENNINDNKVQLEFINSYFDNVTDELLQDIYNMFDFLDILWGYWAFAMHHKYQDNIFLEIGNEKLNRYNLKTCNS